MQKKLVLASTSPYRAGLLRRLAVPFDVVPPRCDESVDPALTCDEAVLEIGARKLRSVVPLVDPGAVVIASDQMMELEGRKIGKPGSQARAVDLLMSLAGKEHRLLTSLLVRDGATGRVVRHLDVHRIRMRVYTRPEAERYVRLDDPVDCAGGIRIESRGIALVDGIAGEDHTAIVGLPLIALVRILVECGVAVLPDEG